VCKTCKIASLTSELSAAKASHSVYVDETLNNVIELQAELDKAKAGYDELNRNRNNLIDEYSLLKTELDAAKGLLEAEMDSYHRACERELAFASKAKSLQAELDKANKHGKVAADEWERCEAELDEAKKRNEQYHRNISKASADFLKLLAEKQALQAELSSAKAEIEGLRESLSSGRNIIEEMSVLYGDDINNFRNLKQKMAITRRREFLANNEDIKLDTFVRLRTKKLQAELDKAKAGYESLRDANLRREMKGD
jgi:chromosome segregation ATPase